MLKSSARIARHIYINEIIYRVLVKAKIASVKEPAGLYRTDGKRSDGLTLIPWQVDKNLVWVITVVDKIAKLLLDVNFSNYWQCCRACRLAQRREIHQYGH